MGQQVEEQLSSGSGVHGDVPPGADLPRVGRMSLGRVPPGFSLRRTVLSHGWCALHPTAYDAGRGVMHRTLALPEAGPVTVTVRTTPTERLEASWGRVKGSCDDRIAIKSQLRRMLALDDDLTELHSALRATPSLSWAADASAGRLLRSPTVFEDLAKTLATTNCSWALTKIICRRLVETLGAVGPGGELAFPTPESIVAAGADHLASEVRVGYRARAFVELAEAVASGAVDPERWPDPALGDDEVLAEIRALHGFGPYAAEGMLGLLGRPRGLALDAWIRARLPEILGRESMTDGEIAERYASFGRWAGTALWLELTADWHT
jgi:N-glycosylase/DNA lyase